MPLYYTIEKKEDSQSAEWEPLTDHKIDPEEASYLSKSHNIICPSQYCCLIKIESYYIRLLREFYMYIFTKPVSKLIKNI